MRLFISRIEDENVLRFPFFIRIRDDYHTPCTFLLTHSDEADTVLVVEVIIHGTVCVRFTQSHKFAKSWGDGGGITFFVGVKVAVKHTSMEVMISSVVNRGEQTKKNLRVPFTAEED